MITPSWFWPWVRWYRGVGEYKPFGPHDPAHRPEHAPKRIPKWAWARLLLNIGRKPASSSYRGLLVDDGVWLDNPRSGAEAAISEIARNGFRWLGINTGDYAVSEWFEIGHRAAAQSPPLHVVPWARVRTDIDVAELAQAGIFMGASAIGLNLEAEAKSTLTPALCASRLAARGWERETITFTEAWLYNAVDWRPLAKLGPALLEIFPIESHAAEHPKDCVAHAHEMGYRDVFQAIGTYGGQTPELYTGIDPRSLFTGDAVPLGSYAKWAA